MEESKREQLERLRNNAKKKLKDCLMTVPEREKQGIPSFVYVKTNSTIDYYFEKGFILPSINLVTGSTGDGKSLTLLHMAYCASKSHKILFISCENSLQTDFGRMAKLKKIYKNYNEDNILYINAHDYNNNKDLPDVKPSSIHELLKTGMFDMVFIDSYQVLFDTEAEDGAKMHEVGNNIMKTLHSISVSKKIAVFMTWQLARIKVKSIDEIDENDISQSIGVARYASTMFVVRHDKKNQKDWRIKLIKSREEYIDNDSKPLIVDNSFYIEAETKLDFLLKNAIIEE